VPRFALALTLLAACGTADAEPPARPPPPAAVAGLDTVILEHVPWVKQKPDFCGEACVEMAARRLGQTYDQDDVFDETGLDPALGRGAYTPDLVHAIKRLGFAPPSIYTLVDARHPQAGLDAEFRKLHADLVRGVPSVVCMHYDDQPHTTEHFRLVVGYDAERDEVVYHEPAEDHGAYRRMTRAALEALWQLPAQAADKRVLVRIALVPGELAEPAPRAAGTPLAAELVQHVMALRERVDLAHLGLTVRVRGRFVIAGAASHAVLAYVAAHAPAAGEVDVLVFPDHASYARAADTLAAGDALFVDPAAL